MGSGFTRISFVAYTVGIIATRITRILKRIYADFSLVESFRRVNCNADYADFKADFRGYPPPACAPPLRRGIGFALGLSVDKALKMNCLFI